TLSYTTLFRSQSRLPRRHVPVLIVRRSPPGAGAEAWRTYPVGAVRDRRSRAVRRRGARHMIDDETAFAGRDKTAVVGIGQTAFERDSGRSVLSLATEASLAALADAGLTVEDVDGIVRCDSDTVRPFTLGAALGVNNLAYW